MLALPVVLWFLGYLVMLRVLVPRMRDRSKAVSEGRSMLTGRIVDSYTNILTVKLFARAREEDAYVRDAIDQHTELFYRSLRLNTLFSFCLSTLNALLVTGTGGLALVLWTHGKVEVGTVAMALPLAWQIANVAGWVALQVTGDLREYRRGAGGHADDRPAARADRPPRRAVARRDARRDRASRTCASATAARRGVHRRPDLDGRSRARRSAWSAAPAPASRRWSTCCCASSTSKAAAS